MSSAGTEDTKKKKNSNVLHKMKHQVINS